MGYLLSLFKIPLIYFRYAESLQAAQLTKNPQLHSCEPQLICFFVEMLLECPVNDGKAPAQWDVSRHDVLSFPNR